MGEGARKAKWRRGFKQFTADTKIADNKYVLEFQVLRVTQVPHALTDPLGARLTKLAVDSLKRMMTPAQWPSGKPPLCLTCDTDFAPGKQWPHAFVFHLPTNWTETGCHVIACPVCAACADKYNDRELSLKSAAHYQNMTISYPGTA